MAVRVGEEVGLNTYKKVKIVKKTIAIVMGLFLLLGTNVVFALPKSMFWRVSLSRVSTYSIANEPIYLRGTGGCKLDIYVTDGVKSHQYPFSWSVCEQQVIMSD